jgi:hypothetical protein
VGLAKCDDALSHWFRGPKRHFDPTVTACRSLLHEKRNYSDVPRKPIEDLGYKMFLWNGLDGDSDANVFFNCGAYPAVPAMPNPNSCEVWFPFGGPFGERLLRDQKLSELMGEIVHSWDPDWARVSTRDMDRAVHGAEHRTVSVGRLTYFSDRYGAIPALPNVYQVTRLGDRGSLISIPNIDQVTVANPEHITLIRRLSEILKSFGLLSPTPRKP